MSGTTTPVATPAVVALTTTPAQRKAAQAVASKALAGTTPAVQGKRNSGSWQGKASAPVLAVSRASGKLAASQVQALVYMAAGGVHHNPRVVARLAAQGMCTPAGAVLPAGAAIVAAVGKAATPASK